MKRLSVLIALFVALSATIIVSPSEASVPGLSFTETGCEGYSDAVARLYTAGLDRTPEKDGFDFWMVGYTRGVFSLKAMADFFSTSPEFTSSYGALGQDDFIRQLYRNVLNREGEAEGVSFWSGQMDLGMDRGTVLLRFSEATENISRSGTSQPTLGVFNNGLSGPWSCTGWTPPNPGDAKNCSDFATQSEAQAWFDYYFGDYGDLAHLDSDGDRLVCESLPR